MFHFSPKEAEYFFGRDVFIEELFQATQTRNFITVLGASGSGKSSVVLAGLVPKLVKAGHWQFTHFRPGEEPFLALAQALVPLYVKNQNETKRMAQARELAGYFQNRKILLSDVFATIHRNHPNQRILLIADQFEELYNPSIDEQTRRQFLDTLVNTFQSSPEKRVLVATLRIDFLGNALSYPPLADVLRDTDVKIRSMNPEELREVIEKPAQKLGVSFESGLVERILKDVDKEPGNLPLLEFALTELWKKRTSKQLTHQAYQEIGEVSGALTSYADREFSKLKPEEQERVRRIFVQLVRPGEGTEDTRRVATKAELKETNWKLVKRLADARLVVTSRTVVTSAENAEQETVEVVHEALIRNWGQLKAWMKEDREFRAWQERIRSAMGQWQEMTREKGQLLRGAALVQAQEKLQQRPEEISEAEQEFIGLSQKYQKRQFQSIIGFVTIVFVAISGLAVVAVFQRDEALIGEKNANIKADIAGLKARLVSGEESLDVQLDAIEVNRKLQQAKKPRKDILIQGANLLREALSQPREINRLSGHKDDVHHVIFSPDGKYLASASSDNTVNLWTVQGKLVNTLTGHQGSVNHVTFSRDGKYLASASDDNTVKLWTAQGKLLHTLSGHQDGVHHVSFSRDGKYLASASDDNTVKLWTAQGKLMHTLTGHRSNVNHVTFSPDGKYLASASGDNTVKLWTAQGKLLHTLTGHHTKVNHVTFSPNGKYLASASADKTVKLWTAQGKLLDTLTGHHTKVNHVTFSRDGKYLASASRDNTVKLWTAQGKLLHTLTGHRSNVNHVTFSPDGQYLASASRDNTVKLWTVQGKLLHTLTGHRSNVNHVTFSPDGQYLASASSDDTVKLWTAQGKLLDTLTGHDYHVNHVTFSLDGQYLASASSDDTVKLWTAQGKLLHTLTGHQGFVNHVTFSRDGKYLASASRDNTVKLWTAEGELVETLRGHQGDVNHVTFSRDGQYLASASYDNTVKLWTAQGKLVDTLTGHQSLVNHVTFSRDGQYLASASYDNTVKLWTTQGKLVNTLTGHQGWVNHVTFSPDGQYLASASLDNTVKLWTREGKLLHTFTDHQSLVNHVTFSPDGQYLASASNDKTVKLWAREGKLLHTFTGHQGWLNHVSFSPDGKYLASASNDNTVKLWTTEGKLVETLSGHQGWVNHVTFSQDGKYLASASRDNTVKLWNFNRDELLKYACNGLSGYLKNNPDVSDNERDLCGVEASATAFLLEGEKLAFNGKIDDAVYKFEKALELDPSLEFEPQAKAIKEALASYKKAQELDPNLQISAYDWNKLCRRGSLYNQADQVMFACEKAVELEPDNAVIIDSRGLARALMGNRKGAIEDFEVFIAWTNNETKKAERQGWVDALKNGENPFTKEVLESLR